MNRIRTHLDRPLAAILAAALALGAFGCAQGGGGRGFGFDTGPRPREDAGPGAMDSGGGVCTRNSECNDGLACNGEEQCVAGACQPAAAPLRCDDGIDCTQDRCDEPGTCVFAPNDGFCVPTEECSPTLGCVARCSESPCRLVSPQCGCPAGGACTIDGTGARGCVMAGAAREGEACAATGCEAGLICINKGEAGGEVAMCGRFCERDADCGGPGSLCLITFTGISGVTICTSDCDPIAQTGCAPGGFCDIFVYTPTGGSDRYLTDCSAPAGGLGQGQACSTSSDCRAGFACLGSQCRKWCNAGTGAGCSAGYVCYGFAAPGVVIGGIEYGYCDF